MIFKTFEELRDYIIDEKYGVVTCLVDRLDELTPFELGRYQGLVSAYDEIIDLLRNTLKYGDDV